MKMTQIGSKNVFTLQGQTSGENSTKSSHRTESGSETSADDEAFLEEIAPKETKKTWGTYSTPVGSPATPTESPAPAVSPDSTRVHSAETEASWGGSIKLHGHHRRRRRAPGEKRPVVGITLK